MHVAEFNQNNTKQLMSLSSPKHNPAIHCNPQSFHQKSLPTMKGTATSKFKRSSKRSPVQLLPSSKSCSIHVKLLLLIMFVVVGIGESAPVTEEITNKWSNSLSDFFLDQVENTMKVPKLQDIYDRTPFTTTNQLGRVESAATAAQLGTLLNDKDRSLKIFAKQACSSGNTNDLLMGMAKSIVSGLTKQNDEQIMRLYFSSHNDGSTMLHSVDGQTDPNEVAPKSSTKDYVPIDPKSSSRKNFQVPNHIVTDTFDVRRTGW